MFNVKKQDIIVTPKIDLINFSIDKYDNSNQSINNFFNKINSVTIKKSPPKKQPKEGYNHSRDYTLILNGYEYSCIVSECMQQPFMPYRLTLHDPTKEAIEQLAKILQLLDVYNVSTIEFVLDFEWTDNDKLYLFLISTGKLAWAGKQLKLHYQTSNYLNNNYTAWSKAGKIYQKEFEDKAGNIKSVTRMEITYKSNFLIIKKIRKCNDIFKVKLNDVFKYISFKEFNYDNFTRKMLEAGNDQEYIENLVKQFREGIANGQIHAVNEQAKSYCKNKTYLKEHAVNKHFKRILPCETFLDCKPFCLNSSYLE